jgi:hypothetical protein
VTQDDAVRDWWSDADEVTRRRALALAEDDPLPEDMQRGLIMAGVRVVPLDASEVDGRPVGYVIPDALLELLRIVRES